MTSLPVVGIVMGSDSDWPVMRAAAEALDEFEVRYETDVVSAHRMPHEMIEYGSSAEERGLRASSPLAFFRARMAAKAGAMFMALETIQRDRSGSQAARA